MAVKDAASSVCVFIKCGIEFKRNTKLDSQKFESSDCVAFAGLHKKGWEFVLGIEC